MVEKQKWKTPEVSYDDLQAGGELGVTQPECCLTSLQLLCERRHMEDAAWAGCQKGFSPEAEVAFGEHCGQLERVEQHQQATRWGPDRW